MSLVIIGSQYLWNWKEPMVEGARNTHRTARKKTVQKKAMTSEVQGDKARRT